MLKKKKHLCTHRGRAVSVVLFTFYTMSLVATETSLDEVRDLLPWLKKQLPGSLQVKETVCAFV